MSEAIEVRKGLVGVYADDSAVSKVMPETKGVPLEEMSAKLGLEQ